MCRCLRLLESCCQHFLETLHPFDTETENDISNYLYNRSREIEPKNCKKPPMKDRKWPNIILKSPGIKTRNKGMVPPLPILFQQSERGGSKPVEGDGEDTPPQMLTPPTPTSPCTPTSQQSHAPHTADNAIFAPVEIGTGNVLSSATEFRGIISGFPSNFLPPQAPPPPPASPQAPPPPLPPRVRKREPSIGDTSPKVKQAPDAPELPPRDVSPPPIPPRTATLPRMHSSGGLQHGPTHHHHAPIGHPLHSGSLHHPPSHHHHTHHHRQTPPSLLAPPPPPQQYQLDPPPHRRNNSVDLSSPTPLARRHTNGPQTGLPGSSMNDTPTDPNDHPPTPPPRLSNRQTFSFSYEQHHS